LEKKYVTFSASRFSTHIGEENMAKPPNLKVPEISVNLKLDGADFSRELSDDIPIQSPDLDMEFVEQPERFAWWATVVELAKDRMARTKYQLERIYALKDHAVRLELTEAKAKITEKIVENSVVTSKEYQECMLDLLETKKQLGLAMAGKESMIQRKDMLISLGANLRAEGSSNISILKDAAKQRYQEKQEEKKPVKRPVGKKKQSVGK
jgi:hypothetical protein